MLSTLLHMHCDFMDDKLPTKTAKVTSLKTLYASSAYMMMMMLKYHILYQKFQQYDIIVLSNECFAQQLVYMFVCGLSVYHGTGFYGAGRCSLAQWCDKTWATLAQQ